MKLPGEAVGCGTGGGLLRPDCIQLGGDGLPAPGRGRRRNFTVGGGDFLRQQLQTHPGFPGGSFGLCQLLAANGTGTEQTVRGGAVVGVGGKAADFQQDGLLVGGQGAVQGFSSGGTPARFRPGILGGTVQGCVGGQFLLPTLAGPGGKGFPAGLLFTNEQARCQSGGAKQAAAATDGQREVFRYEPKTGAQGGTANQQQ